MSNLELFDKITTTTQPIGFPEIVLFAVAIWLFSYFLSVCLLFGLNILIARIRKEIMTLRSVLVVIVFGLLLSLSITIASIEYMDDGLPLSKDNQTKVLNDPFIQEYRKELQELDSRQASLLEKTKSRVLELTEGAK